MTRSLPNTTYQLFITLKRPVTVTIGRLGRFDLPVGEYIYTGSAKRNIEARIARHLRKEKRLRWHIDYLLTSPGADVTRVNRSQMDECRLNQQVEGEVIVKGFGASDCKAGCGSHLKYTG